MNAAEAERDRLRAEAKSALDNLIRLWTSANNWYDNDPARCERNARENVGLLYPELTKLAEGKDGGR